MNNQPTAPQDSGAPDEPFVSRQQYRQQQAKQHPPIDQDSDQETASAWHRRDFANERTSQEQEERVSRLKRRLNIASGVLVVAIIIVYLILFYVG